MQNHGPTPIKGYYSTYFRDPGRPLSALTSRGSHWRPPGRSPPRPPTFEARGGVFGVCRVLVPESVESEAKGFRV